MCDTPRLRPLGDTFAAEALGIDVARPLDARTLAWVEQAFASHPVLVFREQDLGPPRARGVRALLWQAEASLAGRLSPRRASGSVVADQCRQGRQHRLVRCQARHRLAHRFAVRGRTAAAGNPPCQGSAFLEGRDDVRRHGAAYDALSGEMKQRLASMVGLHGRHDGPAGLRLYEGDPDQRIDKEYPEKARPAVVTHPVSGRPILFVNPLHTHGFQGMPGDEAWTIIQRARRTFDPGPVRLLPPVAGWRCVDVGRAGHDAPRCRRLSA